MDHHTPRKPHPDHDPNCPTEEPHKPQPKPPIAEPDDDLDDDDGGSGTPPPTGGPH